MIVIKSLVPGGVAEQDGRLHPGDRLMSVNDTDLENSSLAYAVQTLKGTPKGEMKKTNKQNKTKIRALISVADENLFE